jgi:hypothetical protein
MDVCVVTKVGVGLIHVSFFVYLLHTESNVAFF